MSDSTSDDLKGEKPEAVPAVQPLVKVLEPSNAFKFQAKAYADAAALDTYSQCLSTRQDRMRILRLRAPPNEPLELITETWALEGDSDPALQCTQTHVVGPSSSGPVVTSVSNLSEDGQYARVGDGFYCEDGTGNYVMSNPLPPQSRHRYSERVVGLALQDDIVVMTTRKPAVPKTPTVDSDDDLDLKDPIHAEDSDDDESEASSICSDDEAYESFSECSDDDSVGEYDSDSSSIKEAEDEGLGDEEDEEDKEDKEDDGSSDSSESEESDSDTSDEEPPAPNNNSPSTRAALSVLTSAGRIFHYSRKVVPPLFDSPPLLHPTKPLVVWPFGEGEILFGDYQGKTFYTRSAWSVGFGSRNIFMKCRFSACSRYLHVASLDGESVDEQNNEPAPEDPMKLTLSVYTHRLCDIKPFRCRPNLVYAAWIELGRMESVAFDKPPCTLTWTEKDVYATLSDATLSVRRIPLFRVEKTGDDEVPDAHKPKATVTLPEGAASRQVFFFPAQQDKSSARIVIGGNLVKKGAPAAVDVDPAVPIAFTVDEQEDLGGWVDYKPPEEEEAENDEAVDTPN